MENRVDDVEKDKENITNIDNIILENTNNVPESNLNDLISNWISLIQAENVPHTSGFDFSNFMAGAAKARQW
jgi:hypothetical protein